MWCQSQVLLCASHDHEGVSACMLLKALAPNSVSPLSASVHDMLFVYTRQESLTAWGRCKIGNCVSWTLYINMMLCQITWEKCHSYTLFGLITACMCPPVHGCTMICLGNTLTYQCTVMGGPGGATVWRGTALSCTMSDHEIVLLHSRFESDTGTFRTCSNGAIVGRSLRVEDNTSYMKKYRMYSWSWTFRYPCNRILNYKHYNRLIAAYLCLIITTIQDS